MKKLYKGQYTTFEVDHNEEGLAVITGPEELDRYTAKDSHPVIADLIEDETVVEVIYDASSMVYLDSTGLGTMIGAVKHLRKVNKTFHMQNVGGHVMKALELTDTARILLKPEDPQV